MALGLNFPTTTKLVGSNFVPPYTASLPLTSWWVEFDTLWNSYLKPQIDLMHALGTNCMRIVGDLTWVTGGQITQAQYNARWQTVMAYIAGLENFYAYPTAAGVYQYADAGLTNAQGIAAINSWLAAISDYNSRIVGVDLLNEASNWYGFVTDAAGYDKCKALYDGVKGGGTTLPVTFSTYQVMTGATFYSSISGYFDYLDFHIYRLPGLYTDAPTRATIESPLATWAGYELFVGEWGDPIASGAAANESWARSCWGAIKSAGPRCRGGLQWAVTDQDPDTANAWGIYDKDLVARSRFVNPMLDAIERRYVVGSAAAGLPVFGS